MNRVIANLLIVLALVLLALAYRLKQKNSTIMVEFKPTRRRSGPGRLERLFLELSIIFSSARFGLMGV